jgi:hypothetical protein
MVESNIRKYIKSSIIFDGPAMTSITIYAIPQMAIHQNWINVRINKK